MSAANYTFLAKSMWHGSSCFLAAAFSALTSEARMDTHPEVPHTAEPLKRAGVDDAQEFGSQLRRGIADLIE